jgi:hypothetical protein
MRMRIRTRSSYYHLQNLNGRCKLGVLLEFYVWWEMLCIPGGGLGGWGMQLRSRQRDMDTLKLSNRSPVTS